MVLVVKNPSAIAGNKRDETQVQSLAQEYSSAGGHGNPLQYYCLENHMDRGVWWATVHSVARSQTWVKWFSTQAHTQCLHAKKWMDEWYYIAIFVKVQISWWYWKTSFKRGRGEKSQNKVRRKCWALKKMHFNSILGLT